MKYNLAQLIARRTKRRKFTFATPEPLKRDRDKLLAIYLRVVRHWEEARGRILAAYTRTSITDGYTADSIEVIPDCCNPDAAPLIRYQNDSIDDLQATIDSEASWFERVFLSIEVAFSEWSEALNEWHKSKWRASILSASGVDVQTLLTNGDGIQQTIEATVKQNVALIKSVNAQQADRIADAVFRGVNQRLPAREMAKELQAITGFGRKRSLLIASDQAQKLTAALDNERMLESGLTEFVWKHSLKLHPRPWHKARDGKRYNLLTRKQSDGNGDEVIPADDMPGYPVRCGCRRLGYLSIEGIDDDGNPV